MARTEARLLTSIWDDDDFLALDVGEQRLFAFLLSQPDLAHDGVIALRERRWARKARSLTVEDIGKALRGLAGARFVVVDEDEEEVLVRTFIRNDKVFRQPNVLRAAADHLALVKSATIRAALATEVARILADEQMVETSRGVLTEMLDTLTPATPASSVRTTGNPSNNPPVGGSQLRPGEPGKGTAVGKELPEPRTTDPAPLFAAEPAADDSDSAPSITQRAKGITDAYAAQVPMLKWPAVNAIVIRAIKTERWPDTAIQDALLRLADENRAVTVDSLRIELTGPPKPRGSPTGVLVERNGMKLKPETAARLDDRARFAAMDAQLAAGQQPAIGGTAA